MAAREDAGQLSPAGEVLEKISPPTHPRTLCVAKYATTASTPRGRGGTHTCVLRYIGAARPTMVVRTLRVAQRPLRRIPTLWIRSSYGKASAAAARLLLRAARTHARPPTERGEAGVARRERRPRAR